MKITVNLPDDVPYWYKPVVWFIDPKDEPWTPADLLASVCAELQLDARQYALTGTFEDRGTISVVRVD
jgi:hypothetical protein